MHAQITTKSAQARERQADKHPPLKIALALASPADLSSWHWRLISRIARLDCVEITGRIACASQDSEATLPPFASGVLGLDRRLFGNRMPYDHKAAQELLLSLPIMTDPAVEPVGEEPCPFDVILELGDLDTSDCCRLATFGSWAVRFASVSEAESEWACAKAILSDASVIPMTVIARQAPGRNAETVISSSCSPKLSAARTQAFLEEKAELLVESAIRTAASTGKLPSDSNASPEVDTTPNASHVNAMRYGGRLLSSVGQRAADAVKLRLGRAPDYWQLRFGRGRPGDFAPDQSVPLPRAERNMADPFLLRRDGRLYVFYEADNGDGGPAWISVGTIEDSQFTPLGEVLRRDYHLSYPYIFEHNNEVYMLPETQQSRRLEVWRSRNFPFDWELTATAFEGQFPADSNLIKVDSDWWLFTNLSDHHAFQDHGGELYLFRTDGPQLTWLEPHPQNPVVLGSLTARNAGSICTSHGVLYRPSQIHAHNSYGYGLNLMKITNLDRRNYQEELVDRFTPSFLPGMIGIHHVSFADEHFVIDTRRPSYVDADT